MHEQIAKVVNLIEFRWITHTAEEEQLLHVNWDFIFKMFSFFLVLKYIYKKITVTFYLWVGVLYMKNAKVMTVKTWSAPFLYISYSFSILSF